MGDLFRCPSCNEVIRLGTGACRFCSRPIDERIARLSAEEFDHATQACAMANNIKTGNYGIIFFVGVALFTALQPSYSRYGPRIFVVSFAGPGAAIGWLYKYGKLKTKDPDYPGARRSVLISLALWTGAVLIVGCLLVLMAQH